MCQPLQLYSGLILVNRMSCETYAPYGGDCGMLLLEEYLHFENWNHVAYCTDYWWVFHLCQIVDRSRGMRTWGVCGVPNLKFRRVNGGTNTRGWVVVRAAHFVGRFRAGNIDALKCNLYSMKLLRLLTYILMITMSAFIRAIRQSGPDQADGVSCL